MSSCDIQSFILVVDLLFVGRLLWLVAVRESVIFGGPEYEEDINVKPVRWCSLGW
jgi:hypothetical protein